MGFTPPQARRRGGGFGSLAQLERSHSERSFRSASASSLDSRTSRGGISWYQKALCCCRRRRRRRSRSPVARMDRRLFVGRALFVSSLVVTAVVWGVLSFAFLVDCTTHAANGHWEALATAILQQVATTLPTHQGAVGSMVEFVQQVTTTQPQSLAWPYVAVPGFERMGQQALRAVPQNRVVAPPPEIILAPVVTMEQYPTWMQFAQQHDFYDYYPILATSTTTTRYPDLVLPLAQSTTTSNNNHNHNTSWWNQLLETNPVIRAAVDDAMDCVANKSGFDCSQVAAELVVRDDHAMIFLQPVRSNDDHAATVAIIATRIAWTNLLQQQQQLQSNDMGAITAVLWSKSSQRRYTFHINHHPDGGQVVVTTTTGDHHESEYTHKGRSLALFSLDDDDMKNKYTLTLYPTADFYHTHTNRRPLTATLVAVGSCVIIALCFFIYDTTVHKEFLAKKDLLEAKRRFMRFVSHEVRTPLNAVCMGLDVMQSELDTILSTTTPSSTTQQQEQPQNATALQHADNVTECTNLLQNVRLSAQSAVDVLNTMLNYDKVERNALSLDISILPAWDLVESTVREFHLSATNKKILLSFSVREETKDGPDQEVSTGPEDVEKQQQQQPNGGSVAQLPNDAQRACVLGDSARLRQVLRNLISNAIKFTHEHGSVRVEAVITRTHRTTEWQSLPSRSDAQVRRFGDVCLTVTDTGVGMTQAQLSKVFREGSQFNPNENLIQGSGLGMFISKEIVERHQGSLSAHSYGLEKGTTFTITLPLYMASTLNDFVPSTGIVGKTAAPIVNGSTCTSQHAVANDSRLGCVLVEEGDRKCPAKELRENNEEDRSQSTSASSSALQEPNKLRALLVEDVALNRKLLRRLIERHGHTCVEAENGQIGLEKYLAHRDQFDTILIDYEMPVMNGPTAVKELRRMGCDLLIIGVTGNMLAEDVDYFCKMGANAVTAKPLQWKALEDLWHANGLLRKQEPAKAASSPGDEALPAI